MCCHLQRSYGAPCSPRVLESKECCVTCEPSSRTQPPDAMWVWSRSAAFAVAVASTSASSSTPAACSNPEAAVGYSAFFHATTVMSEGLRRGRASCSVCQTAGLRRRAGPWNERCWDTRAWQEEIARLRARDCGAEAPRRGRTVPHSARAALFLPCPPAVCCTAPSELTRHQRAYQRGWGAAEA
jgi:hypothetical protein